MAKQLNVNLAFQADTSNAKAQLAELQKSLTEIAKMPGKGGSLFDDTALKNASKAALELQQHLQSAMNVNTGQLDLSRFSTSLKAAGKDLNSYATTLQNVGPQGQQAFLQLARSISTAEAPVTRINSKLAEMGTTLKNTVRWQLSSSMLHGFIGTLQSAYHYAQDLNESLTNIRIVTGQTADQMANFAERANRAAQALSTTTTAYTDAALIFYQQGLDDKAVEERTQATIKMAQATGDSAKDVSSYMTAIWNNFDDGSESLEHYADVITALGASTASSSSEIASGLQQFAAIAKTTGLSYDYATSALATLVANTRQSADTIGNSLKTIFSRLQGLKMGDTLEDGLDLNKYSKALKAIGVDVLDVNGNMMEMDDVLDTTAEKWETMTQAQKMAFAQTVAGTRQYTQLMALMDNWDDMQTNLQTVEGADGTLQEQADIYAESWEAAQKRVRAAAESIYKDLLDDKFFIGILNGFEKVLEGIHGVIEGLGGLKGVTTLVGSIFLKYYSQKMPQALENLKQNFLVFTGQAKKAMLEVQQKTQAELEKIQKNPHLSQSLKVQAEGIARVNEMQQKYVINAKNMTEQDRMAYQARIQNVQAIYEEAAAIAKEVEELERKAKATKDATAKEAVAGTLGAFDNYNKLQNAGESFRNKTTEAKNAGDSDAEQKYAKALAEVEQQAAAADVEIEKLKQVYGLTDDEVEKLISSTGKLNSALSGKIKAAVNGQVDAYSKLITKMTNLESLQTSMGGQSNEWKKTAEDLDKNGQSADELKAKMQSYLEVIQKIASENGLDIQASEFEKVNAEIEKATTATQAAEAFDAFQQKIVGTSGDAGSLTATLDQMNQEMTETETKLGGMGVSPAGIKQISTDAQAAADAQNRLNVSLQNGKGAATGMEKGAFKMSTAITQFGSAAMSTYMTINSVKNMIDVFSNDASTGLEKVGAVVSVLTTALSAFNAVQALATTLSRADAVAKAADAVAAGNATIAQQLLNFAMKSCPVFWLIGGVMLLVGAFTALVGVVKWLIDFFGPDTTLQDNLNAATQEANDFKEALDSAHQSAQELQSDFDRYAEVTSALDACAKGTEAWYKQIDEVRNVVDELLEKYPELSGYEMEYDPETGLYNFTQEAIDAVKAEREQTELIMQGADYYAKSKVTRANAELTGDLTDETKAVENAQADYDSIIQQRLTAQQNANGYVSYNDLEALLKLSDQNGADSEAVAEAIQQSMIKKLVEQSGYDPADLSDEEMRSIAQQAFAYEGDNGWFGTGIGATEATDGSAELEEYLKNGVEETIEGFTNWGEAVGEYKGVLDDAKEDLADTEEEAKRLEEEANQQRQNYNTIMAKKLLSDADFLSGMENTEQFMQKAGEEYGKMVEEKIADAEGNYDKDFDKYAEEYLKAQGIDLTEVTDLKKDKDGNVTYKLNGEDQDAINKDTLIDFAGTKAAIADFSNYMETTFVAALNSAKSAAEVYAKAQNGVTDKQASAVGQAVSSFNTAGNFDSITYGQKEALTDSGITAENIANGTVTAESLGVTPELAQRLGYEDANAYMLAFQEALENNDLTFDDSKLNSLSDSIKNGISSTSAKAIEEGMEQASFGPLGEKGGQAYLDGMNLALANIDEDKMAQAIDIFSNADWSNFNEASNVADQLNELGAKIDTDSDSWQAFTESMRDANGAMQDFTTTRENFSAVAGAMDSKAGDTLKMEDYQKLLEIFPKLNEHIIQVDDDTVKLTDDMSSFAGSAAISDMYAEMNDLAALQESVMSNEGVTDIINDMARSGDDVEALKTDLKSLMEDTDGSNLLAQLGYTDERLKQLCESGTQEELQLLMELIQKFLGADFDTSGLQEQLASTAKDFDELQEMLDNGSIGAEAFNKAWEGMRNQLDEDIDADRVEDITDQIMDLAEASDELDDSLKTNQKEAKKIASQLERYSASIKKVTDKYDDWKDALEEINESGGMIMDPDTLNEIGDAMGDMLNIDADSLSDEFLTNAENLELMKEAANGSEEAYEELQARAQQDILAQCDLDTTKFDAAKTALDSELAAMEFDTLEIGANLDIGNALNAMSDLVNSANMTAQQATDYLASMGVDAEVVEKEVETEDQTSATSVRAEVTNHEVQGINPVTMEPVTYNFPDAVYSVEPATETTTNKKTATALEVTSAHKSSGGNFKHVNSGSSSPRRGGGGGGRRGGGGGRRGSRPKERQNKDAKKHRDIEGDLKIYDEEIERYHEIENAIDNIQEKLDKYENIAGRAFGKAKVKALKDSAKAYKDLAKAYNTELQENQDWLNKDIAKARDYGWKLDADGNVSNYEENMKRLVNAQNAAEEKYLREYNKAVAWFNSLSGDAQAEEGNKKKFENLTKKAEEDLEDANKLYKDSVEALKQVEESQEKREELIKQQREALQKALDAEVEAVDVTVQVRLDIADADLKLLKEILEQIGDSADGAADAIGVIGQEVGDLEAKAKAARQGIAETLAVYTDRDLLGDNALDQSLVDKIMAGGELTVDDKEALLAAGITEDTISKLESYEDELIDVNGALRDLRDEALQKTSEAFDEFVENLDRSSEKIQHLQKVTETYKNIIDIVGKKVIDASGELTKQLGKANFEMQRNNTHALKSELEFIDQSIQNQKDAIARLMSDNANGQHDEAIKQMNQQLKEMEDQRDSTYESWLDSWQAEMQAAADIYAETLESVVDNFSDSLAGAFGSLDELEEEFSRKKDIQDLYLDDYRQIYELSKLTRDINKSIDDTDNIKSKQALKSLMEDIEQMQENGVKLSEYDLENLQRQYELELAKQQLKESQEAKSEVRMTRDSEGNYGYVYTADSNAVVEAEQNYEDKLYAMQKANADYIEDLQNNIISAEQACADALAELDASQFASYEEYQEAVARVQADYSELIEGYYQQIGNALDNNRNLYQTEWTEYNSMTGYKISADEDYVDSFNETRLSILTGYNDIETAQEAWNQAVNAATNEAALAYEEWYERTQIALADGETSMQDFGSTVDEVTEDVLDRAEEAENSADAMADSYEGAYTDILNALGDFCINYDSKIQDIISSNTELVKSINKVTKAAANLDDYNNKNGSGSGNGGSGSGSGSDGGNNNSGGGNDNGGSNSGDGKKKGKASWDKGYAAYKRINAGAWGNGISNRISAGAKEGFSKAEVELGQKIINYTYPRSLHGLGYSMDKAKSLLGYDTGGYTGNWNSSDGKLALLHKKELVLNKDDTENMLKAVEVIREINKTIDLNALSASSGFASLLSSSSMINDSSQEIQQTVSIEASFPGVTERGEIEEAFNNLINRAAQFVNRKN